MSSYLLHLGVFIAIYATLAVGLNILVGYCGRLSLTHAVFFALGGYAYAYGTMVLGLSGAAAMGLALLVAFATCAVHTLLSHRRHGDEYVLISLALQSLCYSVMANWYDTTRQFGTLTSFFNGPFGVAGVPAPTWLGTALSKQFVFVAAISTAAIAWAGWLLRSPWGRALKAVRDDEWAAQSLRKNPLRLHFEAAWVASMLAALAGVQYAMYVSYIDPQLASLDTAILVLSMTIIGGVGNLRGPIVGALLVVILPELLKALALPTSKVDSVRLLMYGAALTWFVHMRPQGIAGVYRAS